MSIWAVFKLEANLAPMGYDAASGTTSFDSSTSYEGTSTDEGGGMSMMGPTQAKDLAHSSTDYGSSYSPSASVAERTSRAMDDPTFGESRLGWGGVTEADPGYGGFSTFNENARMAEESGATARSFVDKSIDTAKEYGPGLAQLAGGIVGGPLVGGGIGLVRAAINKDPGQAASTMASLGLSGVAPKGIIGRITKAVTPSIVGEAVSREQAKGKQSFSDKPTDIGTPSDSMISSASGGDGQPQAVSPSKAAEKALPTTDYGDWNINRRQFT